MVLVLTLLYVVRSVTLSGLPRSQVRHPCSTPACPFIIFLYVVRSVILSGLPRSQVRHLCSTPACPFFHSSIFLYVVRSVSISGLLRSHVRHPCSTPACPLIHSSIFLCGSCSQYKWFATLTRPTHIKPLPVHSSTLNKVVRFVNVCGSLCAHMNFVGYKFWTKLFNLEYFTTNSL